MTVILLDANNVDGFTDYMELSRWLELAASDEVEAFVKPHGDMASDGMRAHLHCHGDACDCENEEAHTKLDGVIAAAKESKFLFALNRQFLLEALAGMDDDAVLFFGKGPKDPAVLCDVDCVYAAIIMPMKHENPELNISTKAQKQPAEA
jgi:hypothetical protein